MSSSVWILACYSLLILFALHYDLWRGRVAKKSHWWLYVIMTGSFVNYLFWTWRWDLFSYYLRFLIVILFFVVVVVSYQRKSAYTVYTFRRYSGLTWQQTHLKKSSHDRFHPIFYLCLILFFNFSVALTYLGYFYQTQPVQLRFPLRDGVYYVAHGGNSEKINYHHPYKTQHFALDFMKLNMLGMRAWGVTPKQLDDYMIYRQAVYSPCTGKVIELVDQMKEITPQSIDKHTERYRKKSPAGNHVTIQCQEVWVVLAHMMPNSIRVKKGASVKRGDPIGQVGNSGNTSEPHLHIHAEKDKQGVPILFAGRFLTRNSLFFAD